MSDVSAVACVSRLCVVLLLACTPRADGSVPTFDDTGPDERSPTVQDDSATDDDSAVLDDSSSTDDSSTTSGDIEWILLDSTRGPVTYDYASCAPVLPCDNPDVCCGVSVGIARSKAELSALYDKSLPGIDYLPEVDFSSHAVVWGYLACCSMLSPWLVVDDVTRVGLTLEMAMHIERLDLAPSAFGRPFVVVQVPLGDYDGVADNLDVKGS